MFDTLQMGRRIRAARIERNMTQTELADVMGVSFQAVSNWERGNSMPDIGKLPELCEWLGVTFEQLAGGPTSETKSVERAMAGETISLKEAAEVAPMLTPELVQKSVQQAEEKEGIDVSVLIGLAPFLDEAYLDEMADRVAEIDSSSLFALAPFLSENKLSELARRAQVRDFYQLIGLAPFLNDEALDELAVQCVEKETPDIKTLSALAPFLKESTLAQLVSGIHDISLHDLISLAPFLPQDVMIELTKRK